MKTRRNLIIAGVVILVLVGLSGALIESVNNDGIVEGKVYGLAFTYKANIKGSSVEGRVFDFADRNLPRTSILVPVRDARGIALVREIESMIPSTIRKMHIRVPAIKIEGVLYPAYEYVEWQFRFATRESQEHVPVVIPKK